MDVLVRIDVTLPPAMDGEFRQRLLAEERQAGEKLVDAGVIHAMWRVPGRLANVGIWRVPDGAALDQALGSLPLLAWATVETELLAPHPLHTAGAAAPAQEYCEGEP